MRDVILLLLLVVCSMGTLINSTNHEYQVSIASSVNNTNSTNHQYDVVSGIPSSKNLSSTNHAYQFGMLNSNNITGISVLDVCQVVSGGTIISQSGTTVNVTIEFSNTVASNITCNLTPTNGQCNYIASNISYMTIPYSPINNITSCDILLVTNGTTGTRRIDVYVGYARTDWGKVISGATIIISMIGIYVGYKKVTEEL